MNIDRRLHHAARELREVSIDVPPLGDPARPRRTTPRRPRLAALAAPMLFVTGGLLAVGVMQREASEPMHTDMPAASVAATVPEADVMGVAAPPVSEELRLIAGLLDVQSPPPTPEVTSTEPDEAADAGPS